MRSKPGPLAYFFVMLLGALAPVLWLAMAEGAAAQPSYCTDLAVRNAFAAETVPKLEQCDIAFVRRAWLLFGKGIPLNGTLASATTPADIVINQEPAAGSPTAFLEAGMNITVSTGPVPASAPVLPTLRVEPSQPAQEGGVLMFTITRTLPDKLLGVTFATLAGEGTRPGIDFTPAEGKLSFQRNVGSLTIPVEIPLRAGANGERSVILRISAIDAPGVEPAQGVGQIFDAAEKPVGAFTVASEASSDGLAAILTVTRAGALPPYSLEYSYDASGTKSAVSIESQPLIFAERAQSASWSIPFECASRIEFTVSDPAGVAQIANAHGIVSAPSICRSEPPWWADPVVVGAGIAGLLVFGGLLWWLIWPDPLLTTCTVEHGEGSCSGGSGPPFALPPLHLSIDTEWGGGSVSEALPIEKLERDDG